MTGIRISHRVRATVRLIGAIVVAATLGALGGWLLWDGMTRPRLATVLLGLGVLGTEYVGFRLALGSLLHPASVFVRRLDARQATVSELRETKDALASATKLAGWERVPRLYVLDSAQVNAFVTGRKWERVAGVTRGFVEYLAPDEQRAVLAALMVRERDGAGLRETISSAFGPRITPLPREGVRADFSRSIDHYVRGDVLGVKLLRRDAGSLSRALRVAYTEPGSIKAATPAIADEFFVWPCGHAVTRQEQVLERGRLRALLDLMDAVGGRE